MADIVRRIEAADRDIRAWVRLRPEAGSGRGGRLDGVLFGVKDLIEVAGLPTAYGLSEAEYIPQVAARNAAAVERLEAEGAIAIGKTVTSALAFDRPGPTRNPLAEDRTPGASSSGSAAAVVAGMVPLALGSQAVGSVIRPASYCGVWAFVPSRGAVPSDGSLVLSETLDRIGIFAASADLLMLAAQVLTGSGESHESRGRIGVIDLSGTAPEPGAHLLALAASRQFPLLGRDIDLAEVLAASRNVAAFEFHRNLASGSLPIASLDAALVAELAPPRPSERDYRGALEFRDRLAVRWDRIMADADAIILPSAVAEAPFGFLDDQDPAPAALGSLLGLPAVNIPMFTSRSGLPLGCQMLGRRGADIATLKLASRLATGQERP